MKIWLLIVFFQGGNISIPLPELSCKMVVRQAIAKPRIRAVCLPPVRRVKGVWA